MFLLALAAATAFSPLVYAQYTNCSVTDITPAILAEFPPQLQIPTILSNDSIARDLFAQLQAAGGPALDIAPKGNPDGMGDFAATLASYDVHADPDCWFTYSHCTQPKAVGLSHDLSSCDVPSTWALSFDDGPTCFNDALYDFLRQENIKASMYYIGKNVLSFPTQARKGFEDGHTICSHTWTHHYLTSLTNEQVFAELYYGKLAIKRVLGVDTRCFRPPYGDVDDRVRSIAKFLDLTIDVLDHDSDDWQANLPGDNSTAAVDQQYKTLTALGSQGITVLSHESTINVINAFKRAYPDIKANFRNIVPIHTCANVTEPYLDSHIRYPSMQEYLAGNHTPTGLPRPMMNHGHLLFDSGAVKNFTSAGNGVASHRTGAASSVTATNGVDVVVSKSSSSRLNVPSVITTTTTNIIVVLLIPTLLLVI